jgi:hypothetical protein
VSPRQLNLLSKPLRKVIERFEELGEPKNPFFN